MLAFPGILLALGIVTCLGPGSTNVMIAVGIAAIPAYTRLVRGAVLAARRARRTSRRRGSSAAGAAHPLAPHPAERARAADRPGHARRGPAILAGAALSFLGLGAQPPTPEWGAMLSEGRHYIRDAWWITTFPGLAIMLTVLAINLLGDGLRDALDPRLK